MKLQKGETYSQKHGTDAKPENSIKNEILKRIEDEKVPCVVAFEIAKALQRRMRWERRLT